jgi:hypothetical protein
MQAGLRVGMLVAAVALFVMAQPATAGEIQRRKNRQQHRIAAGVEKGKLSPAEASRLEHQEDAINKEEQAMKDANGGKLSRAERREINHQQNKASRHIYRQKHDANDK